MKKIVFSEHILPHIIAVAVFFVITLFFFKPVFFDHKKLQQHDIQEWEGSAKELRDFREATGEEGLWANSMFSGMPAYLVNVEWGNKPVSYLKKIIAFSLPHPIGNIFAAFVCYYILLLTFGVRPYIAIAGAVGFGLSSYMLIGLLAGHNARIGAIAFMPLVMAGIHLAFTNRRILAFGLTATAFALHLRENHLQITYYLAIIVAIYGVVQLIRYFRAKQLQDLAVNIGILVAAVIIGIGTFLGPLWAISEYTAYSTRGKSELQGTGATRELRDDHDKQWAFEFSNGILEPMTLLIPDFYGGASSNLIIQNQESETYKALVGSSDNQLANQLVPYTSGYWGPQRLAAPYYAGAIIIFLFAIGIGFADRHWVWWLLSATILGVTLSWGRSFEWFNYFLFDYLPGYNKFRSVTFALIICFFSIPLLGCLGLERLVREGISAENKRRLWIAFGATAGLCVLSMVFSGMLDYQREGEEQLPSWFTSALRDDRQSLLVSDAFRSLAFIGVTFVVIFFGLYKKYPLAFYAFLIFMITIDLAMVDRRYIHEGNYTRKTRENVAFASNEADNLIEQDKSHYRVFYINPQNLSDTWNEARTSYFHNSVGGYHGAKMKRYQDLLDSCLYNETTEFLMDAQARKIQLQNYDVINMLNVKYLVFGEQANAVLTNSEANGNAWFVQEVKKVKSPTEELQSVCDIDTRTTAVIDVTKFQVSDQPQTDPTATIRVLEYSPNYLKYESTSGSDGIAVFSEIYYEKGWRAFIDQKEVPLLRANYVLRALSIPRGKHTIEFKFEPAAYFTGNKITTASSWLVLLVLIGSIAYSLRQWKRE